MNIQVSGSTEDWSCVFTEAQPPYLDFRFEIAGSVTGKDGQGTASPDFVSRSGRVIIRKEDAEAGGDWHLNRSYRVLKTIVNSGDTVKWKTFSISTDFITNQISRDNTADEVNIIIVSGSSKYRTYT